MRHRGGQDLSFETLKYKFNLQNFFFIFGRFLAKNQPNIEKKIFLFVSQICILRSQMKDMDPLYVSYINNIQIGHTSIKIFFQNTISENAY